MKTSTNFRYYEKLIAALTYLQNERAKIAFSLKPGSWAFTDSAIKSYSRQNKQHVIMSNESEVFFVHSVSGSDPS